LFVCILLLLHSEVRLGDLISVQDLPAYVNSSCSPAAQRTTASAWASDFAASLKGNSLLLHAVAIPCLHDWHCQYNSRQLHGNQGHCVGGKCNASLQTASSSECFTPVSCFVLVFFTIIFLTHADFCLFNIRKIKRMHSHHFHSKHQQSSFIVNFCLQYHICFYCSRVVNKFARLTVTRKIYFSRRESNSARISSADLPVVSGTSFRASRKKIASSTTNGTYA